MESPVLGPTKHYLEGPPLEIREDYGGLGAHFLDTLFETMNKINQIDTVTGITETNGSVRSRAMQIAHELRHYGIVENDVVLICSRGHADQTVVVLACLLIGAIVAPVDSEMQHKEYVNLVGQLKPKMCFCDLRTLKQMERVVCESRLTTKMVHFGDQQQYAIAFRKLLMTRQFPEQFRPVIVEQPRKKVAFILPTQGTTGPTKLVCHSHHFIYTQVKLILEILPSIERIISFYSLSWVMQVILMCLCFETATVRVLTGAFVERAACKLIQDLKIDHAFLSTDLAVQLAEHVAVKDFNLSCLKCVVIGNISTSCYDIKRLAIRLPKVKFTQIYSTTEVGAVIACTPKDFAESLERLGTAGKVVQNCKLRLVDIKTRKDVEAECSGELLIGSNCMMLGYFKNMNLTKASIQDGYFKTGDLARYDASGWLFIEGQIADMIMIQGQFTSPRELEDVIMMHPFVKDTAVVGNDKETIACVIPKTDTKLDENKLLTFISESLPVHKWPTKIILLSDFPTTPAGKIRRDVLRQLLTVKIERSESRFVMGLID